MLHIREEDDMKPLWRMLAMRRWVEKKDGGRRRTVGRTEPAEEEGRRGRRRRSSFTGMDCHAVVPEEMSFSVPLWPIAGDEDSAGGEPPAMASDDPGGLRMFVGTWNVGGNSPNVYDNLRLREWLCIDSTTKVPHIYIIGFQEMVPLNAGNVIGGSGNRASATWISLIGQALNGFSLFPSLENDELGVYGGMEDPCGVWRRSGRRFFLAASKQMVGIFLSVWIRDDVAPLVGDLKVSCVGRGVLGYLRNKGSVSISMTMNQKTFCFVCSHLASGQKAGDNIRRNMDVSEILKRTRFSNVGGRVPGQLTSPACIMEHDNIVWMGDLNYRLAVCESENTQELLMKGDWITLLKKDQLRIQQKEGRIFKGWEEGDICFPPTYKYIMNSDLYVIQNPKMKGKGRIPAWCDRILWRGKELKQINYTRGECSFSDHRPVSAIFSVQL